ncbi:MAG: VOC family protein [Egibacteraceae bacterium]
MAVELNHIIIPAKDKHASAEFLAEILSLDVSPQFGPFIPVQVGGVTLDFMDSDDFRPEWHHCAFLVTEPEFDEILARVKELGVTYYPNPQHTGPGEINHDWGGRGFYFDDPNGHNLEVLTQPYGHQPD